MPSTRLSSETEQAIAAGMPPCPNCGGRNVRPSQVMRIEDQIRWWFRYVPFRCRTCQHRFYKRPKPQMAGAAEAEPVKQPAAGH